ncbi:MAG: hypothetical protein RL173_404 [Fibrobacterota bacterium]
MSKGHFSVDGTLIHAWASIKSLQPIEDKPDDADPGDGHDSSSEPSRIGRDELMDFRGQTFRNQAHQSVTDPDARLARIGDKVSAKMS